MSTLFGTTAKGMIEYAHCLIVIGLWRHWSSISPAWPKIYLEHAKSLHWSENLYMSMLFGTRTPMVMPENRNIQMFDYSIYFTQLGLTSTRGLLDCSSQKHIHKTSDQSSLFIRFSCVSGMGQIRWKRRPVSSRILLRFIFIFWHHHSFFCPRNVLMQIFKWNGSF